MARLAACFLLSVALAATVALEIWPPILPAETRITPGRPATPGLLPYMAFIMSETPPKKFRRPCCGSLIKRDAVLTSAFCTHNFSKFTVRLGSIHTTGDDENSWEDVSTWSVEHPKYNGKLYDDNDIAIIFLHNIAPQNDFIQVVDLPSPHAGSFIGSRGVVSGWGETHPGSGHSEVLLWAEVVVIPNDICKKVFTDIDISDRTLCAGAATSTVAWTDDGAPVVIRNGHRYQQIGLFARYIGNNTHYPPIPHVYRRLTAFLDWIRQKTALE